MNYTENAKGPIASRPQDIWLRGCVPPRLEDTMCSATEEAVPRVEIYQLHEPPEAEGVTEMQFRLVYRGPLPSESAGDSRKKAKNAIRKVLHPQLAALWKWKSADHGMLRFAANPAVDAKGGPGEIAELSPPVQ
jgi:hypothetical protein